MCVTKVLWCYSRPTEEDTIGMNIVPLHNIKRRAISISRDLWRWGKDAISNPSEHWSGWGRGHHQTRLNPFMADPSFFNNILPCLWYSTRSCQPQEKCLHLTRSSRKSQEWFWTESWVSSGATTDVSRHERKNLAQSKQVSCIITHSFGVQQSLGSNSILNTQKPPVTTDVSVLHSSLYKCHHFTAEHNEKLEWYDDITLPFRQNTKEHC